MVLAGVLYAGIAAKTLYTNEKRKSLQLELSDKIKAKIQDEGLYHVTTREAAEAIIESGFLLPTRGLADNHFAKERYGDDFADFVYMFAGKPSVEMYKNNLSHQMTKDGSIYAIRYKPNEYDINNYTERYSDEAITHEGILDISNSKPEIVRMTVQKGKLVEIPLDAEIKVNPFKKLFNNKAVNFIKGLAPAAREIFRNNTFRDKEGRLKRSIAIRRDTNKMLEQYNNDSQMKEFTFEKDGESYTVSTVGTKMMDGRPLSGFRVSKQNGELDKNVYMEAFDITTIPEEDLGEFIGGHMDTQGVQSEYIGKPVMRDGKVEQEIDQGFMQNFNYKQQRAVKDNPTYAAYMERESKKKVSQIKKLQGMFKRVSSRARQEVLEVIEQARVGRFAQKTKYATRGKMNESSEIDLGGRV